MSIHNFSASVLNSPSSSFYIFEHEDQLVLSTSLVDPISSSFIKSDYGFRKKFHGIENASLISSSSNEDFFNSSRLNSYHFNSEFGASSFFYGQEGSGKISRLTELNIPQSTGIYWDMDLDDITGEEDLDELNLDNGSSSAISFVGDINAESTHIYIDIEGHIFSIDPSSVSSIPTGLTLLCRKVNSLYTSMGIWSFFYTGKMVFLRPRGGPPPAIKLYIGTESPTSSTKKLSDTFPMNSDSFLIPPTESSYNKISYVFR